jgi:hypothetical protein
MDSLVKVPPIWKRQQIAIYCNITPILGEENFSLKIHLEYGGTFTKLSMHVSSQTMFPTTRNLQIRMHVFRPHHCRGD